jgi:hypothetical protein
VTEAQSSSVVTALLAAYPDATLEPESFELYVRQLSRLEDFPRAQRTVQQLIEESPRFPSIAEIRGVYRRLRAFDGDPGRELERGTEEMPEEVRAWVEAIGRDVDEEAPLPSDLASAGEGKCDDCRKESAMRYVYGSRACCLRCTRSRLRAAAKVGA